MGAGRKAAADVNSPGQLHNHGKHRHTHVCMQCTIHTQRERGLVLRPWWSTAGLQHSFLHGLPARTPHTPNMVVSHACPSSFGKCTLVWNFRDRKRVALRSGMISTTTSLSCVCVCSFLFCVCQYLVCVSCCHFRVSVSVQRTRFHASSPCFCTWTHLPLHFRMAACAYACTLQRGNERERERTPQRRSGLGDDVAASMYEFCGWKGSTAERVGGQSWGDRMSGHADGQANGGPHCGCLQ
mgnify:CR=1 FL=1